MKRVLFWINVFILPLGLLSACDDDDDKVISYDKLPVTSQSFIESHFPGVEAVLVEKDDDGYDVRLSNGVEIDFNLNGEWDEVDGKNQELPEGIRSLIPASIVEYVTTNYPDQAIVEINKEPYGYEVGLSNAVELEFNADGEFIRVDDNDDDITISYDKLPAVSRSFIESHFPGVKTVLIERDNASYDVRLGNGVEIDFNLNGEWDNVDGKNQALSESILSLIPASITEYVTANYPGQVIVEINKELYGYEIELLNDVELKFNADGGFIGVDK